jgi:hypothetical protein
MTSFSVSLRGKVGPDSHRRDAVGDRVISLSLREVTSYSSFLAALIMFVSVWASRDVVHNWPTNPKGGKVKSSYPSVSPQSLGRPENVRSKRFEAATKSSIRWHPTQTRKKYSNQEQKLHLWFDLIWLLFTSSGVLVKLAVLWLPEGYRDVLSYRIII